MANVRLPEVLLFDLDDTIVRFSAGQPNFWRLALERQLPERSDRDVLLATVERESREFWSVPERAFWGRQHMLQARRRIAHAALVTHGVSPEQCQRVADDMSETKEGSIRLFDGAVETLHALKRREHRLGLLTNGCSRFQRRKLSRFDLEPLFELILIEGELGYGKPDARVFRAAIEHFGDAGRAAWMIGDNLDADIAGAQALGLFAVWHDVARGGVPDGSTVKPCRVIHGIAELLD